MPHDLSSRIALLRNPDAVLTVLQDEMVAEQASSLGHHGRKMEASLAALRAFDATTGDAEARLQLLRRAAHDVWAFFVQREICGLRDQKQIIKDYAIPGEVLVRLGAIEKQPAASQR
jgi:hypothetical protein